MATVAQLVEQGGLTHGLGDTSGCRFESCPVPSKFKLTENTNYEYPNR